MEVAGRMLDIVEAPSQSRRAKPVSRPESDDHHDDAASFAQTMIGLVTPPTSQDQRLANQATNQTDASTSTGSKQSGANPALYANETSVTPPTPPTPPGEPIAPTAPTEPTVPNLIEQSLTVQDPSVVAQTGLTPDDVALVAMLAGLGTQSLSAEPATEVADPANLALLQSILTPVAAGPKATQPIDPSLQAKVPTDPAKGANAEAWSTVAAQSNEYSAGADSTDLTSAPTAAPDGIDLLALGLDPTAEAKGPSANRAGEALNAHLGAVKSNGPTGWLIGSVTQGSESGANAGSPNPALLQTSASGQAIGLATGALIGAPVKSASKEGQAKVEGLEATTASATLIGSGDGASAAGGTGDLAVPSANDAAQKPPTLGPQTIPLLAAAMMRRYNNGMKEFTLRLDPPELGRVDVRLTVGTDKKVRAVVSTDRSEALSDLTRSARDLTRALMEAGLELEENGLSFSMNDHSNAQQQHTGDQSAPHGRSKFLDTIDTKETARTDLANEPTHRTSGPVETWQRARIALTA